MKMLCPKCNDKIVRKRMNIAEGCLGAIFLEFSFWMIAGILSLILYTVSNSTVIFIISFVILLIFAHIIDSNYATFKCISCGEEFLKSELSE